MSRPDTPAFDRGRTGQRVKAERFDEPGNEDRFLNEEVEEALREPRDRGLNEDPLMRPDAPDLGTLKWSPKPPRGC